MKRPLALLLAGAMVLTATPASFADATVQNPPTVTTPAALAVAAITDGQITSFIETLWKFQGEERTLLIDTLDVYFNLGNANKNGFIDAYTQMLAAMLNYGDKMSEFGLSADVFETLNTFMLDGKSMVYDAYKGTDKAAFAAAVHANKSSLISTYTPEQLDKLVFGLNKVHGKIGVFTAIKGAPVLNVLGYNTQTASIDKLIDSNIKKLIIMGNTTMGLSVSSKEINGAMDVMKTYYNGLTGADKTAVFNHLYNQRILFNLLVLNPLTTDSRTVTGTVMANTNLVVTANGTQIATGVSAGTGAYSIAIPGQTASTVIVVKAVSGNDELDSKSVTVTQANVGPINPPGPGPEPTNPITPPGPVNPTQPETNIPEPVTPLGDLTFEDVTSDQWTWAREAIAALNAKKVVNGKDAKIFDPSGEVTRAEFAAFAVRLLKLNDAKPAPAFKDVPLTAWFANEVKSAFMKGVIKGFSETTFAPDDKITRQEIATITGNILALSKIGVKDQNILASFKDVSKIFSWALEGMKLSVQEGVIKGSAGMLYPERNATRAEAVVMLHRLVGKVPTVLDAEKAAK